MQIDRSAAGSAENFRPKKPGETGDTDNVGAGSVEKSRPFRVCSRCNALHGNIQLLCQPRKRIFLFSGIHEASNTTTPGRRLPGLDNGGDIMLSR